MDYVGPTMLSRARPHALSVADNSPWFSQKSFVGSLLLMSASCCLLRSRKMAHMTPFYAAIVRRGYAFMTVPQHNGCQLLAFLSAVDYSFCRHTVPKPSTWTIAVPQRSWHCIAKKTLPLCAKSSFFHFANFVVPVKLTIEVNRHRAFYVKDHRQIGRTGPKVI